MSVGLNFLESAVGRSDLKSFRAVNRGLFIDNEWSSYDAIRRHVTKFGELPTMAFCKQEGIKFLARSSASDTVPQAWVEKLRQRKTFNAINEIHPAFVESMKARDMESVVELIRDMNLAGKDLTTMTNYSSFDGESNEVIRAMMDAKSRVGLSGITSGIPTLDRATDGIQAGDIWVIAGRPSVGKSYKLLAMADKAHRAGEEPLIQSMEMSRRQLATRLLAIRTGINPDLIRSGMMSRWSENKLMDLVNSLPSLPPAHLLSGDFNASIDGVEEAIAEHRPSVLYLDAIYLMSPSDRKRGYVSRWESIADVFASLKQVLVRYGIGAVVTVQFNRNVKSDSTKAMDMGDVAGGDTISQDASILIGSRKWSPPFQDIRRRDYLLKNREGVICDWGTNFSFNPMDFSETDEVEDNDLEEEDVARPAFDTNWRV